MLIYLWNNSAKFHPDPTLNDGTLGAQQQQQQQQQQDDE